MNGLYLQLRTYMLKIIPYDELYSEQLVNSQIFHKNMINSMYISQLDKIFNLIGQN